jgi:hypothetical protein
LSRSERSSLYPVFTSRAAKNPFSDPRHFPWTMGYQPNYQTEALATASGSTSVAKP